MSDTAGSSRFQTKVLCCQPKDYLSTVGPTLDSAFYSCFVFVLQEIVRVPNATITSGQRYKVFIKRGIQELKSMHIERDVMRVYASFAASLGSSSVENEGQFFVVMLPVQAGNYK